MFRFGVDAERTEATIVRSAQLVVRDVFCGGEQLVFDVFHAIDLRDQRIVNAHEGDLFHAVGVGADGLADLLVDVLF